MILSDGEMRRMIEEGKLCLTKLEENQIQPASIDVRLGNSFTTVSGVVSRIDISDKEVIQYNTVNAEYYVLRPKCFVLATTKEYFKLDSDLSAFVEGRSSIGRTGLFIQNAGWVDPGFEGEITLELFNASDVPIILKEGTRVGQLVFARLTEPAENPYKGKYNGQRGATGSRIHLDYLTE